MEEMGKLIIFAGVVLLIVGGIILLISKMPGLGHLPGDLVIRTESLSCFFPIMTSLLLSVILTIVLNLLLRLFNK